MKLKKIFIYVIIGILCFSCSMKKHIYSDNLSSETILIKKQSYIFMFDFFEELKTSKKKGEGKMFQNSHMTKLLHTYPVQYYYTKSRKDSLKLFVTFYTKNVYLDCNFCRMNNFFLNKEILYRNHKIEYGDITAELKNSLRIIKKFEINTKEIWVEFFLYAGFKS